MFKKIKSFIVALAVLVFILPSLSVQAAEKRIIGFDETYAPFGFKDESGEFVGLDIDLATEILGRMDVEFEMQPIDWTLKETELNNKSIDMIWNGYSVTDERAEVVLFSDPYIVNRQIVIVKADSDIQSLADLAGKTISTQEQSASLEAIQADKDFMATIDEDIITYPTFVEVFADLENDRVDAIVIDETFAGYYLEQNGEADKYRILKEDFGSEDYAVAFRKDDEDFAKEFNKVLADVKAEGKLDEIKGRWLATPEAE